MANHTLIVTSLRFGPRIEEDLKQLRKNWFYFVLFGGLLISLGLAALVYSAAFTIASIEVFGFFMVVSGVLLISGSFLTGDWGGFFLTLLCGVLQLITGFICIRHPEKAAIVYTLLLAIMLVVGGVVRIVASLSGRFRAWGLVLLNGVVALILGLSIWAEMPFSGLWVIGTFLGIDLILTGGTLIGLGIESRKLVS
ncbi:MAG: HdeD family acid-resistance protein [Planctomycetia bacterium]|nr:HdeD family acid-resistance protein [Planctomycetia bacterium]